MRLYSRDYRELLDEEFEEWMRLRKEEIVSEENGVTIRTPKFHEYPKAARHYLSLFPNNYLDPVDLKTKQDSFTKLIYLFDKKLSEEGINERGIYQFIKNNEAYFIIASILREYYNFGHHNAFIFPEFKLGNSFEVDYLLVGQNSDGWHFVFVEIQEPYGMIVLQSGEFGKCIREGLSQVSNWEAWLEANYPSLHETFDKSRNDKEVLPEEFYRLDKTRINFLVVAGRRSDFTKTTYRRARSYHDSRTTITHYDKLVDASLKLLERSTY